MLFCCTASAHAISVCTNRIPASCESTSTTGRGDSGGTSIISSDPADFIRLIPFLPSNDSSVELMP
ncbi:hypothetical protein HanRHA438_Chr14g0657311 [Helianthus annuus]|nr:hypothetical protein HanIR_Chr14g0701381 [Helianthus annuus]KAJ0853970.1 hypothetical protein HanRHA438_Chr14g0657311 [Helianthus annuus]